MSLNDPRNPNLNPGTPKWRSIPGHGQNMKWNKGVSGKCYLTTNFGDADGGPKPSMSGSFAGEVEGAFAIGASRRMQFLSTASHQPSGTLSGFWHPDYEVIHLCCFKPLGVWQFVTAVIGAELGS